MTLASCQGPSGTAAPEVSKAATAAAIPAAWADKSAKSLFGAVSRPSSQRDESFGSYAKGCLAGAVQLPESGPTWQAMRLSRNRNWGTPELVDFLEDLSRKGAQLPGWNGIYIGDMSQPRGGPMSSGHASHQIGLDADIWMLPGSDMHLSPAARESLSSISLRRNAGAFVNDNWTPQHMALMKAAASDPRVARIFVFPGAKVQMCKTATGDRAWLNKIRPWYGHHYHFHVRLHCPAGMSGCVEQAPPPPGDGCAEAQSWVDNILNPPPPNPNAKPAPPKPELTLAGLPAQCVSVLQSPSLP
ncbi:penicillin-insensitive murein endopeptidase [Pseudooceanicola sp. CBS1P-1]|uniref:Penicillin-insensitive murein endopeptidase n=2 Tax=Paracoccaceae TaxID=31989 RepID=A0A6L7G9P3_9RHOB|nr:penicillin-insensitive murein endopeptidase [Pseudooceanicola endophyticus]MXN20116.1 penicillin-insensitive murein endopeptidase [Pseudooceanicola albus]